MNSAEILPTSRLPSLPVRPRWREIVLPKEHGSWSLALEPLALGLLVAPSPAGGGLALAVTAGFLARRPLKIAVREAAGARRTAAWRALTIAALLASGGLAFAFAAGGAGWLPWLAPAVGLGGIFLSFDLQNAWRSEVAEVVGAAAFASLAGTLAAADGWSAPAAGALGFAMIARAVPTVLFVRASVRGGKSGEYRAAGPVLAATLALAGGVALARLGLAPWLLVAALVLLLARSAVMLLAPSLRLRPRTLGLCELGVGVLYLAGLSWVWRSPIP